MKFTTTAAVAAMAGVAAAKDSRTFAVLRFTNKGLVTTRADPIVNPGVPAGHVHNVLGGSNFGFSSTGEDLLKSNCSTALVKGDFSNYWYPTLYFKDPKTGKLEYVDVYYTNVYYFFEATNDKITAFPTGLQMLAGSSTSRTVPAAGGGSHLDPSKGPIGNVQFTCPRSNYKTPSYPAGSDGSKAGVVDPHNKAAGVGFPDVTCDGTYSPLRLDIHFPSCYNPAAGLTNYKENTQFPTDAGKGKQDCPPGWIHTPHIFFEVYYDTQPYKGRWTEGRGTQPFVFSTGDVTGYSGHADFMAGWDEDLLQHIIDTCDAGDSGMDKCPGLFYGLNKGKCTIPPLVDEQVTGTLTKLPGNSPLSGFSYGAAAAVPPAASSKPAAPASSKPAAPASSKPAAPASSKPAAPASSKPAAPASSKPAAPASSKPAASASSKHAASPSSKPASSPAQTPASSPGKPAATSNVVNAGQPAKTIGSSHSASSLPGAGGAGGDAQCSGANVHTITETITVTAGTPAATSAASSGTKGNSAATVGGYTYAGCYQDNAGRVLTGDVLPGLGPMSNDKCVANCVKKGFSIAATEYGGQCYCGNELVGSAKLADSKCSKACEGNSKQVCGGSWAISVYSKTGAVTLKAAKAGRSEHLHRHRSQRN